MERPLFVFERIMLLGGHPWNVLLVARVRGAVEPGRLGDALAWLQRRYSPLRVAIADGDRPRFVPAAARPIPVRWVDRNGEEDWFGVAQGELEQPFALARGPLLRLVCVRSAPVTEIVLIAPHVICDGRSMLVLMRALLARLAQTEPALPPPREFGSIAALFGLAPDSGDRLPVRAYAAACGVALRVLALAARRHRGVGPTPNYVIRWEMDEAATETLRLRARREGITSYTVLATAFLRAMHAVQPRETVNRLQCPVDIRPHFATEDPDLLFSCPPSVRLSIDRKLDHDFWAQARRLGEMLSEQRQRLRPARGMLAAEHLHGLVGPVVRAHLHNRRKVDLSFSHLGETDLAADADGALDGYLAMLAGMPSPDAAAIQSLRSRGRIRFCLVSRETSLPPHDAARLRDHAMAEITSRIPAAVPPALGGQPRPPPFAGLGASPAP